jgi:hypothetical protein
MTRIGRSVVPGRSSARAHLAGRDDGLVEVAPLLSRCRGRFADLIEVEPASALTVAAGTIGRRVGAPPFWTDLRH